MAKKEEKDGIELKGTVIEVLPNAFFRVMLDNGHVVVAYVAGRMRKNRIRVLKSDRVDVAMNPYDLTKGIIKYREK